MINPTYSLISHSSYCRCQRKVFKKIAGKIIFAGLESNIEVSWVWSNHWTPLSSDRASLTEKVLKKKRETKKLSLAFAIVHYQSSPREIKKSESSNPKRLDVNTINTWPIMIYTVLRPVYPPEFDLSPSIEITRFFANGSWRSFDEHYFSSLQIKDYSSYDYHQPSRMVTKTNRWFQWIRKKKKQRAVLVSVA